MLQCSLHILHFNTLLWHIQRVPKAPFTFQQNTNLFKTNRQQNVAVTIYYYYYYCYYYYYLTAIGLTAGGSSTVHIYTQTVHRNTNNKQKISNDLQKLFDIFYHGVQRIFHMHKQWRVNKVGFNWKEIIISLQRLTGHPVYLLRQTMFK
jgi:uncharacterized protein YijF (DUF1287 family)